MEDLNITELSKGNEVSIPYVKGIINDLARLQRRFGCYKLTNRIVDKNIIIKVVQEYYV
jgi:hypothetical protein